MRRRDVPPPVPWPQVRERWAMDRPALLTLPQVMRLLWAWDDSRRAAWAATAWVVGLFVVVAAISVGIAFLAAASGGVGGFLIGAVYGLAVESVRRRGVFVIYPMQLLMRHHGT